MLEPKPLPPAPPPKRIIREDHPVAAFRLCLELVLGGLAVTLIAVTLIGIGEIRAMRSCTQAIDHSLDGR